jgi:hypothetical protein
MSVEIAQPLDDSWSNQDILSRLKNHYELDYDFLLKSPSATEEIRRVYSQVHSSWQKVDMDRLGELTKQVGKWQGWSEQETAKRFGLGSGHQASASAPTIHYRTLFTVGTLALLAGSLAFCAAVIVFCLAFLF